MSRLLSYLAVLAVLAMHQPVAAQNNARLSLDLIPNGGAGNQQNDGITSGTVSGRDTIAIEVFATGVTTPLIGMQLRFDFDATLLSFVKAENPAFAFNVPQPTGTDFAAFPGIRLASSGFLTRAEFTTATDVTDREFSIGLALVTLSESVASRDTLTTTTRISFNVPTPTTPTPDFDGDRMVGFSDFLAFVRHYGTRRGDDRYQAKYDLNSNGAIDFSDFLLFVRSYGNTVPPSSGGGGGSGGGSGGSGGSSSPDLIVESPSVSESTLTSGQSFILRATVRNQGMGESASTTLRYYRSVDATITTDDTAVGKDAVSTLVASASEQSFSVTTAPLTAGTYYYGACVASVSGESNTDNNCSEGVRVTVSGGGGDSEIVEIPDPNLRAEISRALIKARGEPITRAEMTTLKRIDAGSKNINNLTGLEFATNLDTLYLVGNQIWDIYALAGLTNLRVLGLGDNRISDITALSTLTNLRVLGLGSNRISDIAALAGLTNLRLLFLGYNQISDITALAGLTNLRELNLNRNQLSDISHLSGLTKLTSLSLSQNQISDITALSGLTNLIALFLGYNQISDITALSGLTNLIALFLNNNRISDIVALGTLTKLGTLNLGGNRISDIAPLLRLPNLTELYLGGNPLSATSINTHIPDLRDRGVWVRFE